MDTPLVSAITSVFNALEFLSVESHRYVAGLLPDQVDLFPLEDSATQLNGCLVAFRMSTTELCPGRKLQSSNKPRNPFPSSLP